MENPQKYNVAFIHKQKQMLEIVSSDITVILDISKLYGIDVLANSTQNGIHLITITLAKRSPPCMLYSYYVSFKPVYFIYLCCCRYLLDLQLVSYEYTNYV